MNFKLRKYMGPNFNEEKFNPFILPETKAKNPQPIYLINWFFNF